VERSGSPAKNSAALLELFDCRRNLPRDHRYRSRQWTTPWIRFVEMANNAEGDRAIAAINGYEVGGRALNVNEARPKSSGGAGMGRKPNRW
jgi:hypothetical protein